MSRAGYFNLLFVALFSGCAHFKQELSDRPTVTKVTYGKLLSGESIEQYTLLADNIKVKVLTYGGIITQIEVPDRNGQWADVVLGYDNLQDYEGKNRFFGALVGRYANRIENGAARIKDEVYQLTLNRPPHHLHGGKQGFDKRVWKAQTSSSQGNATLSLSLVSKDQDQGYPGTLLMQVDYSVTNDGQLLVEYVGSTDKPTILNPTQHSYFNLSGTKQKTVLKHKLTVHSDKIIELNPESIPTGKLLVVNESPFDFRLPRFLEKSIFHPHSQMKIGKGYDHYFINKEERGEVTLFASLYEPDSGRALDVYTSEVGGQIYTANYLNPSVIGKAAQPYQPHQGICIETGQLPNAPAQDKFDTYVLEPDKEFYSKTVFSFYIK
jgi:aldose 1-epimerase